MVLEFLKILTILVLVSYEPVSYIKKCVFLSYYTNTVPGISSTLHRYCMHVAAAVLEEGENREIHISSQSFSFVDFLLTALQPIRIFGPVKNSSELVRGFLVRISDFHIGQNLKHGQLFR